MMDLGEADLDRETDMGTFGTGPFGNDGAPDLLDKLADQPDSQRRGVMQRIFLRSGNAPTCWGGSSFPTRSSRQLRWLRWWRPACPAVRALGRTWPIWATTSM